MRGTFVGPTSDSGLSTRASMVDAHLYATEKYRRKMGFTRRNGHKREAVSQIGEATQQISASVRFGGNWANRSVNRLPEQNLRYDSHRNLGVISTVSPLLFMTSVFVSRIFGFFGEVFSGLV